MCRVRVLPAEKGILSSCLSSERSALIRLLSVDGRQCVLPGTDRLSTLPPLDRECPGLSGSAYTSAHTSWIHIAHWQEFIATTHTVIYNPEKVLPLVWTVWTSLWSWWCRWCRPASRDPCCRRSCCSCWRRTLSCKTDTRIWSDPTNTTITPTFQTTVTKRRMLWSRNGCLTCSRMQNYQNFTRHTVANLYSIQLIRFHFKCFNTIRCSSEQCLFWERSHRYNYKYIHVCHFFTCLYLWI